MASRAVRTTSAALPVTVVGIVAGGNEAAGRLRPLPPPLPRSVSPGMTEATMARRKPQQPRSQAALPPQLAAVTLHAAGIDVGADAHDVAVPPTDDVQPGRRCGAYTVD